VLGLLEAGPGKGRTMTADENMDNSEWADWFDQIFAELDTPESKFRSEKEDRILREVIYAGLTDLNTGFDSPLIGHFSPADFLIVIDRCESRSVRIIGIEVSTTDVEPPSKLQMVNIEISPVPGYDWARRFVREYMEESGITISVTFDVPMRFSNQTRNRKVSRTNERQSRS
jgi:hypothetical protein